MKQLSLASVPSVSRQNPTLDKCWKMASFYEKLILWLESTELTRGHLLLPSFCTGGSQYNKLPVLTGIFCGLGVLSDTLILIVHLTATYITLLLHIGLDKHNF